MAGNGRGRTQTLLGKGYNRPGQPDTSGERASERARERSHPVRYAVWCVRRRSYQDTLAVDFLTINAERYPNMMA
jgi:hypothetical protein